MSLTNKQLSILQKIDNGVGSTMQIADDFGEKRSVINYLMRELRDEGYIKGSEGFPPGEWVGGREFVNSMLTSKGKTALVSPSDIVQNYSSQITNNFTVESINAPLSFIQGTGAGRNAQINQTNALSQEITEIIEKIANLERGLDDFPEDVREEASVHLENLKSELQLSDNPQPKKIRSYFKAAIRVLVTGLISSTVVITEGTDFLNNITDLADKFDVEIPVEQIKEFQSHFNSLPPLTVPEILPSHLSDNDD